MPNILQKLQNFQQQRYKDKIKKHPYPTKVKFHLGSFVDAINGIIWALKTQPNFGVEIIALVLFLYCYLAFYLLGLSFNPYEILAVIILSGALMACELFNTSIEALSDEVANGEYKEFIRISKDTSAGAVMLITITWLFTAAFLLIPKAITIISILL